MVEVETPKGRVAYGPVNPADVSSLFDKEFFLGKKHPLSLGITEEIQWLEKPRKINLRQGRYYRPCIFRRL